MDGSTANLTHHWSDKPASAKYLGEEYNGCEIIFAGGQKSLSESDPSLSDTTGTTDGTNWDGKLWGYTSSGPAELIAEISVTAGTSRVNDATTALYADTITVANDYHLTDVAVQDSGNNRVAKLNFDTVGYRFIYCEFTDGVSDIVAYIRPY
jgi:hypothetical protein